MTLNYSAKLAKMRTVLANERKHLAYMSAGFATLGVAVKTNNIIIANIGLFIIIMGLYNYYTIAQAIHKNEEKYSNKEIPLVFTSAGVLAVGLFYYQHYKKNKKK